MKNNNGVTIMMLVIIIIVLVILAGVSLTSSNSFMKEVRASRIITNMELIKSKAEIIYESNQFDSTNNLLVGTNVTLNNSLISSEENNLIKSKTGKNISEMDWYRWDKNTLRDNGLDEKMLGTSEDYFYINYQYGEIMSSFGTNFDEVNYYSLTGLKNQLNN